MILPRQTEDSSSTIDHRVWVTGTEGRYIRVLPRYLVLQFKSDPAKHQQVRTMHTSFYQDSLLFRESNRHPTQMTKDHSR